MTDTVSEFHAEALQAIASKGLAQGHYMYVTAKAGFKPTTFQTKGVESANEPPCPTSSQAFINTTSGFMRMIIIIRRYCAHHAETDQKYLMEQYAESLQLQ